MLVHIKEISKKKRTRRIFHNSFVLTFSLLLQIFRYNVYSEHRELYSNIYIYIYLFTGWFGVVQALVTFGFFGILMTFFMVIRYIFVGKCQKNGEVGMAAGIIAIVTGKYRVYYFLYREIKLRTDKGKIQNTMLFHN